jgi:hypothetical protein
MATEKWFMLIFLPHHKGEDKGGGERLKKKYDGGREKVMV